MSMKLGETEVIDGNLVWWIDTDKKEKAFGVFFHGDYTNMYRQGVVESIILADALFEDMLDDLEM